MLSFSLSLRVSCLLFPFLRVFDYFKGDEIGEMDSCEDKNREKILYERNYFIIRKMHLRLLIVIISSLKKKCDDLIHSDSLHVARNFHFYEY